ncbi:SDR family NAD(P)-dependent oxidoreductase [Erwinia sp. DT-104]|jgi:NAD(P)-dependent dehydrogenase (short-subunit alcohol dehydrogenase family)|uniref:SDR family NAD(P)-dependent oxidoreductase n=2 Tax=Erwinia TaxID=551 RepID=A0ABV4E7X8_9GAMM|nr:MULTISPECIES: SDR family oxidoreductase [unclassified Erwinia]MDN4626258.1 SDR family oxidoreductase [Erwinia sp. PsM31]MDN8542508.1 SDR family oxidoreductase [Erwinia sp. BC051422]
MDLNLKDRRVLVSGGSRGIGRAIVECFLAEGARVEFCARSPEGVQEAQQALGSRANGTAVDVTSPEQMQTWIQEAANRLGGLDIIVPNVSALAAGSDPDVWRKAFDTDLMGTVTMVQAALPYLKKSSAASIVLISSVAGREVDMFAEPYGIMKAALIHYGKTLSERHAADGIRVNTVSPGNVYFSEGVWGDIERNQPETFAKCLAANPLGRMATPQEVAKATVFLASEAASFTTGTNLLVDGGLTKGVQF